LETRLFSGKKGRKGRGAIIKRGAQSRILRLRGKGERLMSGGGGPGRKAGEGGGNRDLLFLFALLRKGREGKKAGSFHSC